MPSPSQAGTHLPANNPPVQFGPQSTDDRLLTEFHDAGSLPKFGPGSKFSWQSIPDYGIVHPTRPGYRLVRIQLDQQTGKQAWIWSKESNHEDERNFVTSYAFESVAHPIYTRQYTLLRQDYFNTNGTPKAGTKKQPLKVVIGLVRTADGSTSRADGIYDLEFSGGTGTGVTGKFQVANGKVVAQWLTDVGADYTTAPTVNIPGVDGATIVAVIQPQTALLVKEIAELAPGELASVFITITRVYETLPGPERMGSFWDFKNGRRITAVKQVVDIDTTPDTGDGLIASSIEPIDTVRAERSVEIAESAGSASGVTGANSIVTWESNQDKRTNADIYTIVARANAGTALPAIHGINGAQSTVSIGGVTGLFVVARERKRYSDDEDEWIIVATALPDSYLRYVNDAVRFPGIFNFIVSDFIVAFTFPYPPPFPGEHYTLLKPRTNTLPIRETHYFLEGPPTSLPEKFRIITPGTMSKMVPIPEDTVHGPFEWYVTVDGVSTRVETIPSSNPEAYDPEEVYIWDVFAEPWMGGLWEVVIREASEGKSIIYADPVQQGTGLTIGPYGGGLPDRSDYTGIGIFAVNTQTSAKAVSLFGYVGSVWTKVSGTTPVDAGLIDLGDSLNTLNFIAGNGTAHSDGVAVYTYGTAGTATVTLTGNPSNGDQIKLGFANGTVDYFKVYTFKDTLTENVQATGTLTLTTNAIDGEAVTISANTWTWRDTLTENIYATGELAFTTNPADGTVVVLGGTTYTFKTALTPTANEVLIGAALGDSLDNLVAAVNNAAGAGTTYAAATIANTDATAIRTNPSLTVDSTGNVGQYTSVAVVNGKPSIVYYDVTNTALKFTRNSAADGTGSWTTTTIVSTDDVGQYAQLRSVNDQPVVVYYDATNGDLKYAVNSARDASGTWLFGDIVAGLNNDGQFISIGEANGTAAAAYYEATNGDLKFARAPATLGTLSSWGVTTAYTTGDVGRYCSLATVGGMPAISFYDTTNQQLMYVRATNSSGGAWGSPVVVDTAAANVGLYTSLCVVGGRPAISYYDATNAQLMYIRALDSTGATWPAAGTVVDTAAADVGQYTTLLVVDGKPAIAYYDVTNTQLCYVRSSDANGAVWPATTVVDTTGDVGKYESMAIINGNPAIAYFDDTNDDLKFIRAGDKDGTSWSAPLKATATTAGTLGNAVATTTDVSGAVWTDTTLTGGLAAVTFEVKIGSTASDSLDNLIAAINDSGTEGTNYSTGTAASTVSTAAAGAGDTIVATAIATGTSGNTLATTETMSGGAWGGSTMSGGSAAVAFEVKRGSTTAESSRNLQRAINGSDGSGTAGTHFSTGTEDPRLLVSTEVDAAAFTITTRIPADWEAFGGGGLNAGGAFQWINDASTPDPFPGATFGNVSDISGASNGTLLGTLTTANNSLVCDLQNFDDIDIKFHTLPPTPDTLITGAIEVGNRDAEIWFKGDGGMPILYEKSILPTGPWVAGSDNLTTIYGALNDKHTHIEGITDFSGASLYRFIRFKIAPATKENPNRDTGIGKVSKLFLSVVWEVN